MKKRKNAELTAAPGPVKKAAQRELGQIAGLLLEQAARLEKIERRVKRTPGFRESYRTIEKPADAFAESVAWEVASVCDEATRELREHGAYLAKAAKATPSSLAAEKRARERSSKAYEKREAKRRASEPSSCILDTILPSDLGAKLRRITGAQMQAAASIKQLLEAEPLSDATRRAVLHFVNSAEAIGALLQTLTEPRPKAAA